MALDGIGGAVGLATAGVRGTNDQTRALGAGVSQLLQGAAAAGQSALGAPAATVAPAQGAATGSEDRTATSGPPSSDPSRGSLVDVFA